MVRIEMPSFGKIIGVTCLFIIGLLTAVSAQQQDASVFHSTTRLVQLNMVVVDDHGRAVGDLSQGDIQVFDNGREQKLIHFSRTSPIDFDRQNLSPTIVTNRPHGLVDATGSVTAILVDEVIDQDVLAINLRARLQRARLQILKFLGTLQPGDQVALYALRPEGLVVLHDFTDDPSVLLDAARTLGSGVLKNRTLTSSQMSAALTAQQIRGWLAGTGRRVRLSSDDRLHRALAADAFQGIARHLNGIHGRKNVVWISTTFPSMVNGLDPDVMAGERDTILPNAWGASEPQFASTESHDERVRSFARFLSSTNISIYPIDPQGIISPLALNGGGADRPSSAGAPPPVMPSTAPLQIGPWNAMDLVASETGGRAFYEANGLDHLLREIVDENRVTYILGYYPGNQAWDGKYHHIVVKLKREGLTVRCRKGYYAVDEPLGNPDNALRQAARSSLDSAGLAVTLNVVTNPLGVGNEEVVLNLNPGDIQFQHVNGRWTAKLDIVFTGIGKDGRVLGGIQDHLDLALLPDTYEQAVSLGWFYPKTLFIDPQAEKLRVIVRDVSTGSSGSVSVPVQHSARLPEKRQ